MKKNPVKKVFILNETDSDNIEQVIVILKDSVKNSNKLIVAEAEAIVAEYERKYFEDKGLSKLSDDVKSNYSKTYKKREEKGLLLWITGAGVLTLLVLTFVLASFFN